MKKLIKWLARKFDVNIVTERIVTKEVIEYRYLTQGVIEGDVVIDGNLLIYGDLDVKGDITVFKREV